MAKKIDFEVKDMDKVELDLDDFIWLITELYYACNAIGCVPSGDGIEHANKVLNVIYENNLNLLIN